MQAHFWIVFITPLLVTALVLQPTLTGQRQRHTRGDIKEVTDKLVHGREGTLATTPPASCVVMRLPSSYISAKPASSRSGSSAAGVKPPFSRTTTCREATQGLTHHTFELYSSAAAAAQPPVSHHCWHYHQHLGKVGYTDAQVHGMAQLLMQQNRDVLFLGL